MALVVGQSMASTEPTPEETLARSEWQAAARRIIASVGDKRQREILRRRMRGGDAECHRFVLRIGRERVRQIEERALRKLREKWAGRPVE